MENVTVATGVKRKAPTQPHVIVDDPSHRYESSADEVEASQSLAKRFRSEYSDMIMITVGAAKEKMFVYRDIFYQRSKLFRTTLGQELRTNNIHLPQADLKTCHVYIAWVYGERKKSVSAICAEMRGGQDLDWIQLWLSGAVFGENEFINHVMDDIVDFKDTQRALIGAKSLRLGVKGSAPGTGLRRWIIDHIAALAAPEEMKCLTSWLPADVQARILERSTGIRGFSQAKSVPSLRNKCWYHEHAPGEPN